MHRKKKQMQLHSGTYAIRRPGKKKTKKQTENVYYRGRIDKNSRRKPINRLRKLTFIYLFIYLFFYIISEAFV